VEPKYNDILIALADAINDLPMPCQEQRAGAATGTHLIPWPEGKGEVWQSTFVSSNLLH